jgi:proteasome lid subunit RPN8/RPN11
MTLKIDQSRFAELRRHGEETYPNECCGVLVGDNGRTVRTVLEVIRCKNARNDSPRSRYQIDPRDMVRIQRESRMAGMGIVGFYHSHPDHAPRWSTTDLAEAYWTGCSYIITSVEQGKAKLTNSFVLQCVNGSRYFEGETIQVEPSND